MGSKRVYNTLFAASSFEFRRNPQVLTSELHYHNIIAGRHYVALS